MLTVPKLIISFSGLRQSQKFCQIYSANSAGPCLIRMWRIRKIIDALRVTRYGQERRASVLSSGTTESLRGPRGTRLCCRIGIDSERRGQPWRDDPSAHRNGKLSGFFNLKHKKIDSVRIYIANNQSFRTGLGNVGPAGHIRPAKHISVARIIILDSYFNIENMLKIQ